MPARLTEQQARALTLGPDSVAWKYASDLRLFFASLSALLLQVAHPTVGSGVRDHSNFEAEPWARLFRTIDWVNLTIYGGADAVEVGARLRQMHRHIRGVNPDGSRYNALEPGAYAWVHATLVYTVVAAQRMFGSGMRPDEVDGLYREWLGIGRLLGVREGDLPDDWDGLLDYIDKTIDTELVVHSTVETVLRATVSLIARNGTGFTPGATTRLQEGDELLVVTTEAARDLTERRIRAVDRAGRYARWKGETGR